MTPPDVDAGSVHAKLRLMRQLLDDLEGAGPVTRERLEQDRLLRYAVERILTQLVELAVAINGHLAAARLGAGPADYRSSFDLAERAGALDAELAARLAGSVGLRNILVHEYVEVDLDVVVRSVGLALTGYRDYVRSIARSL
jgi:uncharacterized protein YutE (UPF0331/DUF86 family)